MSRLQPEKLQRTFRDDVTQGTPVVPRRYTLRRLDGTGRLFLTIGTEYDHSHHGGWLARWQRDDVTAEWKDEGRSPSLHVYCHVNGGFVIGTARWRNRNLRREMPLFLECIRYGDHLLFEIQPKLDYSQIWVHFSSAKARYSRSELWGIPADYKLQAQDVVIK